MKTVACKICRREGDKLFLKGERCNTAKCAFVRRKYPPGMHGPKQYRPRHSSYGLQLRFKQKIKRLYNIREKQFIRIFQTSLKHPGNTGDNLLKFLESRLDNIIYRVGLADSRRAARQLVNHGHFKVNSKKTDVPSCLIKPKDEIMPVPGSLKNKYFQEYLSKAEKRQMPKWIAWDKKTQKITILAEPDIENLKQNQNINTKVIIEYYSRQL